MFDSLPGKKPTKGGLMETETKDPITIPRGPSGEGEVTRVTPVGYLPSTFLYSLPSIISVSFLPKIFAVKKG